MTSSRHSYMTLVLGGSLQTVGAGPLPALQPPSAAWDGAGVESLRDGRRSTAGCKFPAPCPCPVIYRARASLDKCRLHGTQRTASRRENRFSQRGARVPSVTGEVPSASPPGAPPACSFCHKGPQNGPPTLCRERLLTWTDAVGLLVNKPGRPGGLQGPPRGVQTV